MEEKCFLTCQLKVWLWGRPRQLAGCPFPAAGQPVLVRLWQCTPPAQGSATASGNALKKRYQKTGSAPAWMARASLFFFREEILSPGAGIRRAGEVPVPWQRPQPAAGACGARVRGEPPGLLGACSSSSRGKGESNINHVEIVGRGRLNRQHRDISGTSLLQALIHVTRCCGHRQGLGRKTGLVLLGLGRLRLHLAFCWLPPRSSAFKLPLSEPSRPHRSGVWVFYGFVCVRLAGCQGRVGDAVHVTCSSCQHGAVPVPPGGWSCEPSVSQCPGFDFES